MPFQGLPSPVRFGQQKEGAEGSVMEAVIHFWAMGRPGYIILLTLVSEWLLWDCKHTVLLPSDFRLALLLFHACFLSILLLSLELEQDLSSQGSGEELALLAEPER